MPKPQKQTILLLITDLQRGGSPLMLLDLAKGLAKNAEFQPIVISLKPLPPPDNAHSIPEQLAAANIRVESLHLDKPWQFPRAIKRLRHLINDTHPAIAYSILMHANLLTTLALRGTRSPARPRFIQALHTLQPNPQWHWTVQRKLAPRADAFLAPAQPILDAVFLTVAHKPLSHPKKISLQVIPNGIDIDRFANAVPVADPPWPATAKVIGYVGRFDPVKSIPLLLQAVATLPLDYHLALVGYGPQEKELKNLATSLHITPRVHFPGPSSQPERWYKSFHLMCLPSSVEGFGLTFLEALAAGIPVVGIKTPVTEQVVRDGIDGKLVPNTSPDALASAIQEVTKWSSTQQTFPTSPPSSTITHLKAHFSVETMVARHVEFFKNLLQLIS